MTTGTFISLVLGLAISLLIGLMGVYMLVTGKTKLLHDYHRATTDPNDLPRLARYSGCGMTILGTGIALITAYTAAASGASLPVWMGSFITLVLGVALCIAGMVVTFVSIHRFNGSLFS
ncbi:MAG: hypothetical protein I3I99_07035 [Olsenella umbonata]|nr:hypothetical protein [Parafannyhessea umbonata]